MALSTGKVAEVMFEKALETHEHQMDMLDMTTFHQPDGGAMQNSGNFIWYPVEQHAPVTGAEARFKKKYDTAHGKQELQSAYNTKKEARAAGVDVSKW